MQVERGNLERFFSVGAVAMFHADVNRVAATRFKTHIRGWRREAHIIIDRPRAESGSYVALQDNQGCVIRFLNEGYACAFDAYVIDWDTRKSNAYCRLTWPSEVQYLPFRKFERLTLDLPCELEFSATHRVPAAMRDMSMGGCGAVCEVGCEKDAHIKLHATLPDGTVLDGVEVVVRNARPQGSRFFLGCEYLPNQPVVERDVSFYVTSTLMNLRGEGSEDPTKRVLVIDAARQSSTMLKVDFERFGVEVVVADNIVDGIYRMRAVHPDAVALSWDMTGIPALELCKLLQANGATRQVPIYIYGGEDEPDAEARAMKAGATKYYPYCEVVGADLGKLLSTQAA